MLATIQAYRGEVAFNFIKERMIRNNIRSRI